MLEKLVKRTERRPISSRLLSSISLYRNNPSNGLLSREDGRDTYGGFEMTRSKGRATLMPCFGLFNEYDTSVPQRTSSIASIADNNASRLISMMCAYEIGAPICRFF